MFSHVMLGVNDLEVSKKFYDALLGTLGIGPGDANRNRYFYRSPTGSFAQIRQVKLAHPVIAKARRLLAGGAAVGDASRMEGVTLLGGLHG